MSPFGRVVCEGCPGVSPWVGTILPSPDNADPVRPRSAFRMSRRREVAMTLTDQDTRADILEALGHVNATAKTEARRGLAGTRSKRYEDLHVELNWLLGELERLSCA